MPVINEYHRPEGVEEALQLLAREHPQTVVLAGGTNLGSPIFAEVDAVVDLQALGLNQITIAPDRIDLGAMVRIQQIVEHPGIPPLVSKMAQRDGPNTFRNAGTIGGVVVGADTESELYATFLVHEAQVTIQTVGGTQQMPLQEFSLDLLNKGLILSICIVPGGKGAEARVARTPADSPIVAVVGRKNEAGEVRLAFCGIAERPIVVDPVDLVGLTPPADFRGSSAYRQEMANILCKRVLKQLTSE